MIKKKVNSLKNVGWVRRVDYPTRLLNIVLASKAKEKHRIYECHLEVVRFASLSFMEDSRKPCPISCYLPECLAYELYSY